MTEANAHWAADISNEWLGEEVARRLNLSESRYELLIALNERNESLLFALRALTKLDQEANGGIIVGPRGWQIVQDAITREENIDSD